MTGTNPLSYRVAVEDFKRMRRQAAMRQLISTLTGQEAVLLSYNEVIDMLEPTGHIDKGLQEIPVEAIVGSVGRYQDFTRDFLPKHDADEERWARVKAAVMDMRGFDPIEVYQIGDVYFVKDGNHRVSVTRHLGVKTISARVTEVQTRVPLTPEDDPTQVVCKARYVDFLAKTNLDKLRPDADLLMTYCGEYETFLRQIRTHQGWMQLKEKRPFSFEESVASWYDEVYLPVVQMIRAQGALHHFRRRTEADLYILLLEHQEELQESLGWRVKMETAVADMASSIKRIRPRLPQPGEEADHRDTLFGDILIALRGNNADWQRLHQVIDVAKRENGRLLGLHVVPSEEERYGLLARKVETAFTKVCQQAGVPHDFAIEVGAIAPTIIQRAAWADLVVAGLNHPPGSQAVARLSSGFNAIIQRCPRPILALPGKRSPMDNALLAYDGSPKADEALYVAAYLALRWQTRLTVVTVETAHTTSAASDRAREYLTEYGISADYVVRQEDIAGVILETAVTCKANLMIMGGFGFRPVLQVVLGSTVDKILRQFPQPILICR
ncbi:MAG: universal stress protein [Ardenticatenaceae bacterium]|nr:universal stress protein [Anaerolineales bacterium]MCB8921509.1 universal stress protein [Ardenticatenaceae bacterium]MCB8990916.1 universal stress protein [Ardenticatenaceae bacterium]MCB9004983.1 universal stress protein [Ardenticatenaceae bacterium]